MLSIALMLSMYVPVHATQPSTIKTNMSKAEFADYIKSVARSNQASNLTNQERADLVSQFMMDGFSQEEIYILKTHGLYLYSYATEEEVASMVETYGMGQTDDVAMEVPSVVYAADTDQWMVAAGGKWTDISWASFLPGNVGDVETVGFVFYKSNMDLLPLEKTPEPEEIYGSLLSYTYKGSDREVVSYTDCLGNYDAGIACQMQDKTFLGGGYRGEAFATAVYYDNRFENVTGAVRSFYVHTGEAVELTSLSLGFSIGTGSTKTWSVNAEFSKVEGGFCLYSGRTDF